MEKVSVITPVYKCEKTIIPFFDSLLNQTYKNYEVIIVIKKSQDKTEEIVKQYQKKFPKIIRTFYEETPGIGPARRKGEINADGSIIIMTDADCVFYSNWIERLIEPIIKKEFDAVQGYEEDLIGNYWSRNVQRRSRKNLIKLLHKIGLIDTKNFAISKEALKNIGYSDAKYIRSHDNSIAVKFHQHGYRLKFLINVTVKHYHPSTLKEVFMQQYKSGYHCRILSNDYKKYFEHYDFLEQTNQTFTSFMRFFPGIIIQIFREPKHVPFDFISGFAWRLGLLRGWYH